MATNLQDVHYNDGIEEVFHRSTLDWLNQEDLVAIYNRHQAIPFRLSRVTLGPLPLEEGIFLYRRQRFRGRFEWDDVEEVRRRNCRSGPTVPGAEVTYTEASLVRPEEGDVFTRRNYHRGTSPFCLVHYLFRPGADDGGAGDVEADDGGDEADDDGGDEADDDGGDEADDDGGDEADDAGGDEADDAGGDEADDDGGEEYYTSSSDSSDDVDGDPDYVPEPEESEQQVNLSRSDASIQSLGYLSLLEEALTRGLLSKGKAYDVALLIAQFEDKVVELKDPLRGVGPLLSAVHKVQASAKSWTALHPTCLQLCLRANCYKAGFPITSDDILEVDESRGFHLYCYYGGMICIGLKRFQKASELLYNVVTAPMYQVNAIALEAYKKYILVNLIHSGQFSNSLPKCASTAAQRSLKSWCTPYCEVGNRYNDGKISELEAVVVANSSDFEKDNNLGLVKQAVASLYKRNILRLTQKYLTLSLQDIANMVQLANAKEAEMHVLQMIQDGQIHALINQKDGMVRFLEDPEQYKTSEMIEVMDSVIQRTIGLSKNLIAMDESLSCDPLYLGKVGRERQRYDFGEDFDTVPQKFSM